MTQVNTMSTEYNPDVDHFNADLDWKQYLINQGKIRVTLAQNRLAAAWARIADLEAIICAMSAVSRGSFASYAAKCNAFDELAQPGVFTYGSDISDSE